MRPLAGMRARILMLNSSPGSPVKLSWAKCAGVFASRRNWQKRVLRQNRSGNKKQLTTKATKEHKEKITAGKKMVFRINFDREIYAEQISFLSVKYVV